MADQPSNPPTLRAVSRAFAAGVYVAEGEPTARDLVLWLSMLTPGLADYDEQAVSTLAMAETAHVAHRPMDLIREARVDRMARLGPMHGRLMGTRMGFMGAKRHEDGVHGAFDGWGLLDVEPIMGPIMGPMGDTPGRCRITPTDRPPTSLKDLVGCRFPGMLMALGQVSRDLGRKRSPVVFDIEAMGEFKSRYSPILFLRCLAWLKGGYRVYGTWKRKETTSGVVMTIPVEDVGRALGCPWLRTRTEFDDLVFKRLPKSKRAKSEDEAHKAGVIDELDAAGVALHPVWVSAPGYQRKCTHLSLTVTRTSKDKTVRPWLQAEPAPYPEGELEEADLPF